ncbi:MAG: hypothetical protein FWD31_00585 [Planctomycetaceae bacterium]|nr:hypothetical protein [Planctomycetaceae bacterium]
MKLNPFLAVLVVLPLLCMSVAFAQKQADSTPKRVAPSEFIIFPWGGMPGDPASGQWGDLADMDAMMRDLYDCGFNTSGFTGIQNLQHARNNRLMGILSPGINPARETTQANADETIQKLMESIADPEDRKAVYAIYLRDEPNASLFPQLNVWSDAVKKHGVLPYINLYPDYASPEQLGSKDYEEHLDQYVEICQPPYISYDNYSLFEGGRLDENRFYGNLESIRNKSLQAEIPFWNVILSNAHFTYAEPSDATLAIQVYSTLAYGGKGIGYFTYYAPQVGNYRLAPIDRFGYRTKTWEMMRNINLQIHSLVPVYGTLKSVNVFHTGDIPRNGQGIESAKIVESVDGGSLLVGEFVDPDGKPYAMIVNKSMQSSIALGVQFKEKGRMMLVSPFHRGRVPFTGEQVWLAPGCGALLTVE